MNQIYASGGKIQEGFWDNVQMPDSVRAAYGSNLKKLTKHMNGVADAGGDAKASLEDLNRIIIQNGEAAVQDTTLTQKLVGGLKSVGSTALSMAGNMALNFVVSKGLEWVIGGISDWVNRDQIAIDNGKKSQQTISDTFNEFSKGKTTLNILGQSFASTNQQITSTGDAIQSVATKYTELSKGVDKKTNANIGLSDEDYQTYLDISSQLATLYPQLQSGTDAQGNAMLNLGTNAKNAAKSIQDLYSSSMLSANVKIGDELQQAFKGVSTQVDKYQKQVDEYDEKAKEYRKKSSSAYDFVLTDSKLNDFIENQSIHLDSRELGDKYGDYMDRISDIFDKNKISYDIISSDPSLTDKNGNPYSTSDLYISDPDVTKEQLQQVGKEIASFSDDLSNKFSAKASEMESKSASTTALIQDQWKGMTDSLGQYLQTTDSFDKLDSNLKTNLLKNLKNLDIESLSKEYDGDALQFMYDKFIMPLSNLSKDQQQAISDALNIDEAKSTASQYANQVNSAFEKIFPNDKALQEQWKKNFGLQDIIDDNSEQIETLSNKFKDAKSKITKFDLGTLTNGDRDIAYNLVVDDGEAFNTFDELQKRIAETKQTLSEKDLSLDAMKQVVTDTTTAYSSLSTAMSESISGTGMTADSITAVKTALSSLVSENDAFKGANLDGIFRDTADGVDLNTDAMKSLIKQQHDMKVDDFTKSIQLQNEAYQAQQKIIDDVTKSEDEKQAARDKQKEINSDINAIQQAQSQYYAQYKQMENMFSDYSKWMQSASQETAGTPYNNIVSGLEQAYKDFQNDLVGTDSFKNFAAMISPTGATDPADFEENYAKAKRYLQEGDDGVKNFLNDLKSHDLATFNQETGEWVVKAHSAAEAAKALATGTDVASAAFGKLEDYGFHDNTVDDVQDGILKIGEAYTNLADAKSKLKEMEANPENYSETRIQAQRDEVEAYTKDIGDLTDNMQYYIEHQVEEYQQQKDFAENAVKEMAKYQQEIQANPNKYGGVENANQLSNYLTEQMQGYGESYGIDAASIQKQVIDDTKKATQTAKKQIETYKDVYSQLQEEQDKINDWGLSSYGNAYDTSGNSFVQKQFGNIDMDKRQVITWSNELKKTYSKELASWDYEPEVGGVDTVFGGSDRFGEGEKGLEEGVEVAFTPIMNTPDGKTQFLGKDTVYDYINQLIGDSTDNGVFSEEKMLSLDKQGRQIGDKFVQGIIAGADTSLNYDNDSNKAELYGRMMHFSGAYGALGLAYSELGENAEDVVSTMGKVSKALDSNDKSVQDSINTLQKYSSNELEGINLFDGAYDSEDLKPAEQALDSICQTLGLSKEEASQLVKVLEGMDIINSDNSSFNATNDELTQAQEKLNELTGTDYKFNFDTSDLDTIQQQIDQAKKQLEQFKKDGQVDYSQEGAQEASDIYEASVRQQQDAEYNGHAITQVGSTDTETSQLLSSAREFMQAKNELDVQTQLANEGAQADVDTAREKADAAYEKFKELNEASGNKLGLDTSDIQSTESDLLGLTEDDLKVKVGADTSQAQEDISSLQNVSGSTVTLNCDVTNEESFEQTKSTVESMPKDTTATVNMVVNGESDVEKTVSLIKEAPKNQNSELVVNCTVANKEEYDTIMQAQNDANSSGANIKVNATIGEVDTSSADASSTPVEVQGQIKDVEPYSGDTKIDVTATIKSVDPYSGNEKVDVTGHITSVEPYSGDVDVNAKANITGVIGGDNLNVVVNARAHITGSDGQTAEGTINYKKGNVEKADGTTSEGIINYKKGDVEKADGTVSTGTINYDLGNVATPDNAVATGVINYTLGSVAKPAASGTIISATLATGTFGQARAFAKGSLTDFPAYGHGKVSLSSDEKALVNELGMESIVRDGVWSMIPGGAHIENLKKGDIIFSASQTEDLLKHGATPGHARAYAQGSLSDLSLSLAPAHAGTRGSFYHDAHKTSVSSGSSSSSDSSATQQHTDAVKDDTSATEDNTKSAKDSTEAFDWVKTKLDKFAKSVERISNQITDYISSTFKTVLLKRQVKAVEKQLKANEQGYTAYMNKANSVDISDDYKNKVINGTFSIEEIDTSSDSGKQLAKDIKSFQTYYNSAQDCKDTVQELNNKLLELYETIVNMPTEKAEKKIDRLKTKLESLNAVSDTVSLGGSAIAAMQNQIKVDIPGLGNAQKKLDKAETARNATKKTRAKASKTLKSATADAESTGNTLIKASEKQAKSIGKKLKSAAKSSTNKATYNAIAQAIREGKAVNTKGLKGSALKYAKSYNSSLKQGNTIASKVKAGKTVKTSGMSNILKSTAQAYNADAKEKASAQKVYDNAKKADEKALDDLTKAQKNKDKLYAGSTKEQQILATTKGKKSYVYQNMLLTQETKNLKEQNKHRQKALKETRDSYMKAKNRYDIADADKTKSQNKILNNKSAMSKLNKTQKKALKAGKTVSTKGITDPKVLKWIQDYNEKVKKSTDLSKKLRIEQEALDKATSEAAQSQAEYAQSIVENAKKKLENIANYYDSFTSQWENRNSMYEAYMDRMQTQGYNLSTKFYEAEIGQQQKIVDNLSQKYIAMKRNFAQAVQDGTIVEGTEEYYEMQNEIDQVAISLKEAQNKVVEFQASIRDLKWEQFDQLQDAIGRITSESDFLIDLMSHKDMYDKDGNMTEQGLATMGLHGVNYNTYMAQADKYKEEMLKISEELANDPNNQKLIDRKNELIDAQQQAILSAEDEKDSIKDLIQDGIDKQLDALDDLIDKYLDVLDSEKDLYQYRKKIGEQSEKIASLQKQLSSLQGDNSEENKAKLQKLKEDLKSAQDDMEETQYDKYISDQKKLLDELKQDYKKALDDRMDNVDVLISDAIASINSNSSNISQTLQTESKNVGYTLSGEMQTIWTSQSQALSMYDGKFDTRFTGITTAIGNVYDRQKDMIDAIDDMAEKWIAKADQMLQQPTKTEGVLEEVEQKPDKDNVAEGNPTPDPPKVSDKDSIKDAVLADPDEPKKKPNKTNETKTGNGKAEVGDKVTFSSGRYYEASDGSGASGNMYLGKKVKITRINKGSKYPYAIDATDGTELGWVKLNQLKGYASGIMRVPNDQLAWTQEQGEEAIVRNDGSILTPLSRDVSVLNADMTKNLWDFMGNPGSFLSDYSDGEKFGVKNVDNSSSVDVGGVTIQCNMPNVQNANDLLHELTTNKDIEKAIKAMTIDRIRGGSSLAKYKYRV